MSFNLPKVIIFCVQLEILLFNLPIYGIIKAYIFRTKSMIYIEHQIQFITVAKKQESIKKIDSRFLGFY